MKEKIEVDILPATIDDVTPMGIMLRRAWLDTYPNEQYGVTVEVIEKFFRERNSPENLKKRVERFNDPKLNDLMFVAISNFSVVGMIRIVLHAKSNQIRSLYVDPDYYRRGVGSALVAEAEKHFSPTKRRRVWAAAYNERAIKFYRSRGYWRRGHQKIFKIYEGVAIPEIEMAIEKGRKI